jgi:hypothetical protein
MSACAKYLLKAEQSLREFSCKFLPIKYFDLLILFISQLVGIVRMRTQAMEFSFLVLFSLYGKWKGKSIY